MQSDDREELEAAARTAWAWFTRVVGFLTLLLLLGLAALVLASCGGGDPEPPPPPDTSRYPTEKNR